MQWLINELKVWKKEVIQKIDDAIAEHTKKQIEAAEELHKLRGEITAMKARMAKVRE